MQHSLGKDKEDIFFPKDKTNQPTKQTPPKKTKPNQGKKAKKPLSYLLLLNMNANFPFVGPKK